jgi:hypothetical protein
VFRAALFLVWVMSVEMSQRLKIAGVSVLVCALSAPLNAQRGRGAAGGGKPAVDIVQTVGCAERKSGSPETWWINRAAEPRVAPPAMFNSNQVAEAKAAPLGANAFQLVGVADFLDRDSLLRSGQRKEFTNAETANASNQLRAGHKILIKGLLIEGNPRRINLLSVVDVGESCGA